MIDVKLQAPTAAKDILLHTCCAPCSGAIVECMLDNGLRPVIFYYNPNIFPDAEYERRKAESMRHAGLLQLDFVDCDHDYQSWRDSVKEFAAEPERGLRCLSCFKIRLTETARYAYTHGFQMFATTLSSSRWKDLKQIDEAGNYAASLFPGVAYWAHNWRKGGLDLRRNELIRRFGFYNQTYCGCEFSLR